MSDQPPLTEQAYTYLSQQCVDGTTAEELGIHLGIENDEAFRILQALMTDDRARYMKCPPRNQFAVIEALP